MTRAAATIDRDPAADYANPDLAVTGTPLIHRRAPLTLCLWVSLALIASTVPGFADQPPLTSEQLGFIDVAAYVVTARERCGFEIDGRGLGVSAARLGLDFNRSREREARNAAFDRAGRMLSGLRGSPECAQALKQYGPDGTVLPGLLRERP